MASSPVLYVWLVLLIAAAKMPLEEAALVEGTYKTWAIYFSLDVYGVTHFPMLIEQHGLDTYAGKW